MSKRKVKSRSKMMRRWHNPVTLARHIIGRVAEPGSRFSLTALKQGLKGYGYKNIKGWFDEMLADAIKSRVLSQVSKGIYVFTPAAANPIERHWSRAVKSAYESMLGHKRYLGAASKPARSRASAERRAAASRAIKSGYAAMFGRNPR